MIICTFPAKAEKFFTKLFYFRTTKHLTNAPLLLYSINSEWSSVNFIINIVMKPEEQHKQQQQHKGQVEQ